MDARGSTGICGGSVETYATLHIHHAAANVGTRRSGLTMGSGAVLLTAPAAVSGGRKVLGKEINP